MFKNTGLILTITGCIMLFGTAKVTAQVDSLEIRKPPVLSDLPIIYDRNQLSDELAAMKKPILKPSPVVVSTVEMETRLGNAPALQMVIPETSIDNVKRTWQRYLRKEGDGKLQRDGNTLFMEDVMVEEISSEFFNAEMRFDQDSSGTVVKIAMEKDSVIMNPQDDKVFFDAMEDLLVKRGKEAYRDKVEEDLNTERDVLDGMEKELSNLVKDNEKSHKNITDNNIEINQTNMEIDQNEIELRAITQELVQKRSAVSSARDKDSKKAAKKAENSTEKTQKRLQKDREKMFQGIIDSKREIAESEQDISRNLEEQRNLLLKMHQQTLLIEAIKDKMEAIQ